LFKHCQSASLNRNAILFNHAKGGLSVFKRWIEKQKQQLNEVGDDIQFIDNVKMMESELQCDKCKSPISNFFIMQSKKYMCLRCGKQAQKGYRISQIHYRLLNIDTCQRIMDKVRSEINSGSSIAVVNSTCSDAVMLEVRDDHVHTNDFVGTRQNYPQLQQQEPLLEPTGQVTQSP
jgi:DNA-directed RNA polymerase subunit RPC12/RpoP